MRKKLVLLLIVTALITLHEPTTANAAEYTLGSVFWESGTYQVKYQFIENNGDLHNELISYTDRPQFDFQYTSTSDGTHWPRFYNIIMDQGAILPDIHMRYNNPRDQPSDFEPSMYEVGKEWTLVSTAVNIPKGVTVTFRITPARYSSEDITPPEMRGDYQIISRSYKGFSGDFRIWTYGSQNTDEIIAEFAYSPTEPTTLDTLSVVATSKSDALITSYMWFINGIRSPDIQQESSWTYPNPPPGELEIRLDIKDSKGKTSSITKTITITDVGPPEVTPKILMIPEQPTTDTPIQFFDSSSIIGVDIQARSWYFDGEYLDTVDIPVWTWDEPTPGTHTVALELFDGETIYPIEKTFTVTDNEAPQTPTLNIRLEAKADGKTGTRFWAGQKVYLLGSVNKDNPQPDQEVTIII
ncbi:MAG: hypothetical protein ACOC6N_03920, partial [archaeon]